MITALLFADSSSAFGQQDLVELTQGADLLPQEREVVRFVNEYREGHGLRPLRVSAPLCRAARNHAESMAGRGRMSHVLDERDPSDRARAVGFLGPVAENVAAGNRGGPREFFGLWIASAAHRSNILGAGASEIGVGFVRSEEDEDYWVAMFGALP